MNLRDEHCSACGLCKGADTICLPGQGPSRCDIMVIGEAPGAQEDETGRPFEGKSGALLDELLDDAGLSRKRIRVTNAVRCRPPGNRTPKKKEIEACKQWLKAEIAAVKPKFILTLGNVPLQSLLGLKGIRKLRGMPIEQDGIVYFPTYHPSYALRDPRQRVVIQSDIEMFARIVQRGGIGTEKGLNYRIVSSWSDVDEALADIKKTNVISYDTETTGLHQFDPTFEIVSLGLGTRTTQWCFPLWHPGGWLADRPNARKRLVAKLDRALDGKTMVAHNGKFDTIGMAAKYGVWWYVDFDTMLAHYNLDENTRHDLKFLCQLFFGAIDYDIPLEEKHGKGSIDRHCKYLALDIYYTRKLYFLFKQKLREDPGTKRVFEWLTMPVARMYADIEALGPYVERGQLSVAREHYREQAKNALSRLNRLVPDNRRWKDKKAREWRTGINWGSPQQVAEVLFKRLKLKPLDKTASGADATTESVLLRLAKLHEVPKLILEYREAQKNIGFLDAWDKLAINSRMHPSFKVHGTVTGRPSCEDPNLQQTPRNAMLRSCISAPEGYTLLETDQSQVELRITAEYSRDPALMHAYQTGQDIHTKTVQSVFGIMNPTDEERKKGKAINFGFVYGMWWKKFLIYARDNYGVEVTPREAQSIREGFFRLYAGLPAWHKRQKRFANQNGYVRNLIGRLRRLPAAMARDDSQECREAERQAINSPVQSLASDITLMGALALHGDRVHRPQDPRHVAPVFPRDVYRLVGSVHDALLGECKNEQLGEVIKTVTTIMADPPLLRKFGVKLSIPLVADAKFGPWGAGKKPSSLVKKTAA